MQLEKWQDTQRLSKRISSHDQRDNQKYTQLRKWVTISLALLIGMSSTLMSIGSLSTPTASAQGSVANALTNGNFEDEFFHQDGCGMVAAGWNCFHNGGAMNYTLRSDQRNTLVLAGAYSQRVQLNTMNLNPADDDRFAGIYQTVAVAPTVNYTLNLYGMIHTSRMQGDPWRHRVELGWNEGQDTDWRNVTNWQDLNWRTFYERNTPGVFSDYSTDISSQSSYVTLFVRLWNKWGHRDQIVDLNLDAFSLLGPPPAVVTVCEGPNWVLNGSFDQGFVNIDTGTIGQYWGAFTTSQDGANYRYQSESQVDLRSDGAYGQSISIDSIGIPQPRRDRLAGVYYRLTGLNPNRLYELTVHGQLRATESIASAEHFSAQWGYATGSTADPRSVQDWFLLELGSVRPDNITGQMTTYVTRFQPRTEDIVLFMSAWKQSRVADVTVTMNLDEISLRSCTTQQR